MEGADSSHPDSSSAYPEIMDELLGFCGLLRAEGVPIDTGRARMFCDAVAELGPENTYWSGRALLLTNRDDRATYDLAFRRYWRARGRALAEVESQIPARPLDKVTLDDELDEPPAEAGRQMRLGLGASPGEVLGMKGRIELTSTELVDLRRDLDRLAIELPSRITPRLRSSTHGVVDLPRTIRAALRLGGEPLTLARATPRRRTRRLVLFLDVSRSMSEHSERLALFAHAMIRRGVSCEVFCFGTHVTCVTTALARRVPQEALASAMSAVSDWDGGTRIGESLEQLLADPRNVARLRGSTCVILSDGLDTGEPELMGRNVGRLRRLVHRLLWMNPMATEIGYAPTARSMRAALPHLDAFVAGSDLPALTAMLVPSPADRQSVQFR
jgi:uncharacterized protein with von Willebrand factor type A (vWA) domain